MIATPANRNAAVFKISFMVIGNELIGSLTREPADSPSLGMEGFITDLGQRTHRDHCATICGMGETFDAGGA